MNKIACPRCTQDWVKKVYIGATDRTVFLCFECEATWFSEASIEFATFLDLGMYLRRKDLTYSSSTCDTFVEDKVWFEGS